MTNIPTIEPDGARLASYIDLYKHLHAHPELSMQEHATADLIEERARAMGAETFRCGGTGVVAIIRNGDGPTIAFRADIDGLPLEELTGLDYASVDHGVLADGTSVPTMHACGHDAHITSAIAAGELLAENTDLWSGTLVLIFQPGEETGAGSAAMIADGLWDKAPRPEIVLGQHLSPATAGTATLRSGNVMSLADSWEVTINGVGAHGSRPEDAIDPIVIAAYTITRLQTVVSRELNPQSAAVVTVGTFHAGLKENIIPSKAVFTLNIRSTDETIRAQVLESVRRIVLAESAAAGADEPTITELYRFPRNYNDPTATPEVVADLAAALGSENVDGFRTQSMGSEDFGWLGDSIGVPTVFWWFGAYAPGRFDSGDAVPGNHSALFGPDVDAVVPTGIRSALAAILGQFSRRTKR